MRKLGPQHFWREICTSSPSHLCSGWGFPKCVLTGVTAGVQQESKETLTGFPDICSTAREILPCELWAACSQDDPVISTRMLHPICHMPVFPCSSQTLLQPLLENTSSQLVEIFGLLITSPLDHHWSLCSYNKGRIQKALISHNSTFPGMGMLLQQSMALSVPQVGARTVFVTEIWAVWNKQKK